MVIDGVLCPDDISYHQALEVLRHEVSCKYRQSALCAVWIECAHDEKLCKLCDVCTCAVPRERFLL